MWIVIVSISSAATLILVLILCSCWKRQRHKDDWLGLDGMVKQKNPDENVNHIPLQQQNQQAAPVTATLPHLEAVQECAIDVANAPVSATTANDEPAEKRPSTTSTNTRRSLPDIPAEGQALQTRNDWTDGNGDNISELYATVGPYAIAEKKALGDGSAPPIGADARPTNSSQGEDAPYASVNYDTLPQVEHPYAMLKNTTEDTPSETEPLAATAPTSGSPTRSSSTQSVHDINAASAVAGGVAANQELPYITLPILPTSSTSDVAQTNFSGDSQDSSKGYTSISVREPIANLRVQVTDTRRPKRGGLDPHYSTVSDDSDEMYTTIPDPVQPVYTSGSETYAQIHPPQVMTVAADIYPVPFSSSAALPADATPMIPTPSPQPPSVDSLYQHISHGSPKPEKRQANSPLPPPPPLGEGVRRNVDDMYAKVQKNRKQSPAEDVQEVHDYETLKKSPKKDMYSDPNYEQLKNGSGYSTLNKTKSSGDLKDQELDPNYESVPNDPNYESVKYLDVRKSLEEPNKTRTEDDYETIRGDNALGNAHDEDDDDTIFEV